MTRKGVVSMAALLLVSAAITGCAGNLAGKGAGEDASLKVSSSSVQSKKPVAPYVYAGHPYADPSDMLEERMSPLQELEDKILRDGENARKYGTKSVMFYVPPGGYQQAILRLANTFDYQRVVFSGDLEKSRYNCQISEGFWLKGSGFADIASKILAPYSLEMIIHKPDRVVVINQRTHGNPCKTR